MQWFLYFLYYVQAAQPVPSTKVQASWQLIQYWWPTHLQGAYVQVYETCCFKCDNNNYHWYAIGTTDGNVTYVYDIYS